MARINLLPKEISELIAAGEVVERPASVAKELIENSIDAGAKHITVEIKNGGITYLRITDDGSGINSADVPLAFLRHATSKIKTESDLDAISSLGFRGEALAATCTVSHVELFTKSREEALGTHYMISGGTEELYEESGCPDGTTIIVRDLFYNTPARMKFLKTDVKEGSNVQAIVERTALSHPEIAFKLIKDSKPVLNTTGDGKMQSAIYSVLGREFAKGLIAAEGEISGVRVRGFVCKPIFCRPSRSYQFTFLNGRLVNSRTVIAAAEQAYKNSSMVGKFPAFVLNIEIPFETVDVNVHPAKTEVRFSDEKRIFEAVYHTVKNAISLGDTRPEIKVSAPKKAPVFEEFKKAEYVPQVIIQERVAEKKPEITVSAPTRLKEDNTPIFLREEFAPKTPKPENKGHTEQEPIKQEIPQNNTENTQEEDVLLIGEAFKTYIVVQKGESVFLIDKHAAHERIIFNRLKSEQEIDVQPLLIPVNIRLEQREYSAVLENSELLLKAGFEIDDFGNGSVVVRTVPSFLSGEDITSVIIEAASSLMKTGLIEIEKAENIFHTVSCKAAIKAGYITSKEEMLDLAKRVLRDDEVRYCPHGRPVAFEIKKRDLEKQFGRIQ